MGSVHHALQIVLNEFKDIFVEPTHLPPKRAADHLIPLVSNSKLINLRTYVYFYF
jgi:hypothetical protein